MTRDRWKKDVRNLSIHGVPGNCLIFDGQRYRRPTFFLPSSIRVYLRSPVAKKNKARGRRILEFYLRSSAFIGGSIPVFPGALAVQHSMNRGSWLIN